MNLDELTDIILQRLSERRPRALLIGKQPERDLGFQFVEKEPYEAVVLGLLPAGELLRMPSDTVCEALLAGVPVWLWTKQPYRSAKYAPLLCRELASKEQHLKQLGVRPITQTGRWITAQDARRMLQQGLSVPSASRLTPLAKEILEGKEP